MIIWTLSSAPLRPPSPPMMIVPTSRMNSMDARDLPSKRPLHNMEKRPEIISFSKHLNTHFSKDCRARADSKKIQFVTAVPKKSQNDQVLAKKFFNIVFHGEGKPKIFSKMRLFLNIYPRCALVICVQSFQLQSW